MKKKYLLLSLIIYFNFIYALELEEIIIESPSSPPGEITTNQKDIENLDLSCKNQIIEADGLKKLMTKFWLVSKNELKKGALWSATGQNDKVIIHNPFDKIPQQIGLLVIEEAFIKDYISVNNPPLLTKTLKKEWFSEKHQIASLNDTESKIVIAHRSKAHVIAQVYSFPGSKPILELKDCMIGDNYKPHAIFWTLGDTRIITRNSKTIMIWDSVTGALLNILDIDYFWDEIVCFNHKKSIMVFLSKMSGVPKINFLDLNSTKIVVSVNARHVYKIIENLSLDVILTQSFLHQVTFYDFNGEQLEIGLENENELSLSVVANTIIRHTHNKLILAVNEELTIYNLTYSPEDKKIFLSNKSTINLSKNISESSELIIKNITINPHYTNLLAIVYNNSSFLSILDMQQNKIVHHIENIVKNGKASTAIDDAQWSPDGQSINFNNILCKVSRDCYCLHLLGKISDDERYIWSANGSKIVISTPNRVNVLEVYPLKNYFQKELTLKQAYLLVAIEKSYQLNYRYRLNKELQKIFNTFPLSVKKTLYSLIEKRKTWVFFLARAFKKCNSII